MKAAEYGEKATFGHPNPNRITPKLIPWKKRDVTGCSVRTLRLAESGFSSRPC